MTYIVKLSLNLTIVVSQNFDADFSKIIITLSITLFSFY